MRTKVNFDKTSIVAAAVGKNACLRTKQHQKVKKPSY